MVTPNQSNVYAMQGLERKGFQMSNQRQHRRSLTMRSIGLTSGAFVMLSTFLPCGCSKPREQGYFPEDHYGLRQEYSVESSGPLSGARKGRVVFWIDGKKTINGKAYFKEVTVISGIPGAGAAIQYRRWDSQGIHTIDGDDETQTEYLDTPLPINVGDAWTVKKPKGEAKYRAEAIEPLDLPDRKYDRCLKLAYQDHAGSGYSYYAPGLGQVKGVIQGRGVTVTFTLDSR
jgi:hypothetical protein